LASLRDLWDKYRPLARIREQIQPYTSRGVYNRVKPKARKVADDFRTGLTVGRNRTAKLNRATNQKRTLQRQQSNQRGNRFINDLYSNVNKSIDRRHNADARVGTAGKEVLAGRKNLLPEWKYNQKFRDAPVENTAKGIYDLTSDIGNTILTGGIIKPVNDIANNTIRVAQGRPTMKFDELRSGAAKVGYDIMGEGSKDFQGVAADVGETIMPIIMAWGGGKATQATAKSMLNAAKGLYGPTAQKAALKQLAKQTAKEASKVGAGFGLAGAAEEGREKSLSQDIIDIAVGGVAGAVGGAVLGGAIPYAGAAGRELLYQTKKGASALGSKIAGSLEGKLASKPGFVQLSNDNKLVVDRISKLRGTRAIKDELRQVPNLRDHTDKQLGIMARKLKDLTNKKQIRKIIEDSFQPTSVKVQNYKGVDGTTKLNPYREADQIGPRINTYKKGFAKFNEPLKPVEGGEVPLTVRKPSKVVEPRLDQTERGFVSTLKGSAKTSPEVKAGLKGQYSPITNPATIAKADAKIGKGFESAVHRAKTQTKVDVDIQAESLRLMDELQSVGRHQDALDIAEKMSERATSGGQATQILAAYNKLEPEGVVLFAQRNIDKARRENPSRYKDLAITPQQSQSLRGAAEQIKKLTGEAKADATRKMLDDIARLVPSPAVRKITTIWKAGLLTGIKGAVGGNTVGNASMAILKKISDAPSAAIDSVLSTFTGTRSKAFTLRGMISGFGEGFKVGAKNLRKGIGAQDITSKLDYKKVYFSKSPLGKAAQGYTDFVFNFYSASDKPFLYSALKNNLFDMATVQGKNKRLTGKALRDYVNKTVKSPNDELIADATEAASEVVFQNKNQLGQGLSSLKKGIKSGEGIVGDAGELVAEGALPFTGVPSAITTAVHNYNPTGAVVGVIEAIIASNKGGFNRAAQRKLSESLGKGLTGTAAIWLGAHLTQTGQMTLGYPTDAGERALWEEENKIPYAIQIGGKWRSLNYTGPIMALLAIGGEIDKASEGGKTDLAAVGAGALGSGKAILGSSPLQGAQAGLNAITDPQRYGDSYFNNLAASIVPTITKDIAVAGDPTQREKNTAGEAIQAKIPYFRNKLLPKRGFSGEPLERRTSAVGAIIDPLKSSEVRKTKVNTELRRLQDEGFGPTLSRLNKNQTIFGQKVELEPEQLDNLEKESGGLVNKLIKEAISLRGYKGMSDEDKQSTINDIVNDGRTAVKESQAGGLGVDADSITGKYKKRINEAKFEDSGKKSDWIDDVYYYQKEDGKTGSYTKDKYESKLRTQKMERAKDSKNYKEWAKLAEEQLKDIESQFNDADPLTQATLQNDYLDLARKIDKYAGYGGFKKGKVRKPKTSSIGSTKFSISGFSPVSTPKVTRPKIPAVKRLKRRVLSQRA